MPFQDWSDPQEAKQWDEKGDRTNPARAFQLELLLCALATAKIETKPILDLGFGSGRVEELIFNHFSHVQIVGIDQSQAMMDIAKKRLEPYGEQFVGMQHDLRDLHTLNIQNDSFSCVIAVQSLHHLVAVELKKAYSWIYKVLQPGGVFLLLDRMRVENERTFDVLQSIWRDQDRREHSTVLIHEGNTFMEHQHIVQQRGDFPALLDEHMAWLRETSFDVACLHAYGNRALIAGIKGGTNDRAQMAIR